MIYDFRDNRSGINPLSYLLTKTAGGLLDNVISGMFERAAQAKAADRSKAMYGGMGQVMSDPNAGRAEFMSGLSKYGPTAEEAKTLMDLYGPRLEYADKLGYGDAVVSRVGDLDYDVRTNPLAGMQSGMKAQAYGLKPEEIYRYAYPNMVSQNVDLDDRYRNILFDPASGGQRLSDYMKGISAEAQMQDATKRRGQDISVYTHNTPSGSSLVPSYKTFVGEDGSVYVVNNKTGGLRNTGVKGPIKAPAQGTKPYSTQQKINLGAAARKTFELSSASPEEKWNYMVNIAGEDKDALRAMASAVFSDGQIPAAAMEFLRTGGIRKAGKPVVPAPAKSAQYFPKERLAEYAREHKVSVGQAKLMIESKGYSVE